MFVVLLVKVMVTVLARTLVMMLVKVMVTVLARILVMMVKVMVTPYSSECQL